MGETLFMVLDESPDNRSLSIFDVTDDLEVAEQVGRNRNAVVVDFPIVADFRRS